MARPVLSRLGNYSRIDGGTLTYGVQLLAVAYDTETDTFEPKLAKSLVANDDATTWTLTLREDVKFSDGTPLDAAAVAASIDRYNQGRGNGSDLWLKSVDSIVPAADGASAVFNLKAPWQRFPSMLALGHGMIVAPSAQQGDEFKAIGAGPFTEGKFAPNEERIFTANPGYYAGKPHLDTLRMVALNGPQANIESLRSGQLDVAYICGLSEAIDAAKADGYPGYISVLNAGGAENGNGLPGSALFGPTSQWHTDTPGIAYDPAKATELLAAAVADGYNGELNYVVRSEPKDPAIGLAVQSLLQAVGFKVNVVLANNAGDIIQNVYVKKDFDLAHAGLGMYESIIDLSLDSTTNSASLGNTGGYANPEMDQLIADLQATQDDDAARAVIAKIQALWNETVPSAPISALPSFWAWQKNVHGVTPTATGIMLFDAAWLGAK